MICQLIIYLSVGAPLISVLSLLQVSHNNGNFHIRFVFTLLNLVFKSAILIGAASSIPVVIAAYRMVL